jgi:ABC-type polysaccharide/polyol phosphate export permease
MLKVIHAQFVRLWVYRWQIWVDITKEMTADSRETAGRLLWVVALPLAPLGVYLFLANLRVFPGHDHIDGVAYVIVGATLWLLFSGLLLAPINAILNKGKVASQSRYPLAAAIASAVGQVWVEFAIRAVLCAIVLALVQWPSPLGLLMLLPVILPLSFFFLGGEWSSVCSLWPGRTSPNWRRSSSSTASSSAMCCSRCRRSFRIGLSGATPSPSPSIAGAGC